MPNYDNSTVNVIDLATNAVVDVISDPSFTGPFPVAVTPDGKTAYVGSFNSPYKVTIIDVASNAVTGIVNGSFDIPEEIAITPNGKTAYVADSGGNTGLGNVVIINIATNTVTGVISDSSFNGVFSIGITPDGKTAYVPNVYVSTVSIIDIATNIVIGLVSNPNFSDPYPVATLPAPQSPINQFACKTKSEFLTQTDFINKITFSAPISTFVPTSYQIYRDAALTDLVVTVPANGNLCFKDHNRICNATDTYYIVSVDQFGDLSFPAVAISGQNCKCN